MMLLTSLDQWHLNITHGINVIKHTLNLIIVISPYITLVAVVHFVLIPILVICVTYVDSIYVINNIYVIQTSH